MHETDRMRGLVAAWDSLVCSEVLPQQSSLGEAHDVRSVLRPAAPEAAIAAVERRLGQRLPPSYRAFLGISNGAYATPQGPTTSAESTHRRHSSVPDLGFLAVDDLQPLAVVEPAIIAAFTQDPGPATPRTLEGAAPASTMALQDKRVLLVSSVIDNELTALVPVREHIEWELWQFSRDDIAAYTSFAAWLEHVTQPPNADHVMDLIRWAREGDERGNELGDIRDPAALPILLAALDEFPDDRRVRHGVVGSLGRIKSDATVPVLEGFLDGSRWRSGDANLARRALRRIASPAARDALARDNDHLALLELGDERAGPIAAQRVAAGEFWAARTLGQLPDPSYVPLLTEAWALTRLPRDKLAVASALLACGSDQGRRFLSELAGDGQFPLRQEAQAALRSSEKR